MTVEDGEMKLITFCVCRERRAVHVFIFKPAGAWFSSSIMFGVHFLLSGVRPDSNSLILSSVPGSSGHPGFTQSLLCVSARTLLYGLQYHRIYISLMFLGLLSPNING